MCLSILQFIVLSDKKKHLLTSQIQAIRKLTPDLGRLSPINQEDAMGFVATDLAKVPAHGFDWYLFLLTDSWEDPVQDALLSNFDQLSTAVGTECLVYRFINIYTY